jgi:hypothetical protein
MGRQKVLRSLADKLKIVRKYTGDRFGAGRGYDLRKPMSKARQRTIGKYFDMVTELTSTPHKIIEPARGTKRETFEFTGQIHHPKFTKAIIRIPDPTARYTFSIDKTRPKGSRFTVINRRTREKSWHIPAAVFLDENENLYDEDEDIDPDFFESVLEEYAERGEVYLIEAGDFHMWGSVGSIERVSGKLSELFKQYGAGNFDQFDKNSHFIGNWFRGVQVYSDARDFRPYLEDRVAHEVNRLTERYGNDAGNFRGRHFRILKSGAIGEFYQGRLIGTIQPTAPATTPKKPRRR